MHGHLNFWLYKEESPEIGNWKNLGVDMETLSAPGIGGVSSAEMLS